MTKSLEYGHFSMTHTHYVKIIQIMKVEATGEGVEDDEEGGGSVAQVKTHPPGFRVVFIIIAVDVTIIFTLTGLMVKSRRF